MGKIQIQKIVRPLLLKDYAPEMGDATMWVWVNPTREMRSHYFDRIERAGKVKDKVDAIGQRILDWHAAHPELAPDAPLPEEMSADIRREGEWLGNESTALAKEEAAWWSRLWSQGADPETRLSPEDVERLVDETREEDPALWSWLVAASWRMINEHLAHVKKG